MIKTYPIRFATQCTQIFKRTISFDKLSNKRITRLESDIELESDLFPKRLTNRNPRNLEQLSLQKKPEGFWLDKSPPINWNKLVFEQKGRYLYASLMHWSGKTLIEASTRESTLAKYFKSPSSIQATTILAQVITRRCLQSGYLYAGRDESGESSETGPKTKAFFEFVKESGMTLEELPEIKPRRVGDL